MNWKENIEIGCSLLSLVISFFALFKVNSIKNDQKNNNRTVNEIKGNEGSVQINNTMR